MARKSNVKAASLSTGDAETKEVIDVNLASQAGDEPKATDSDDANVDADDIVNEDNTEQTPSTAPSVAPSEKPKATGSDDANVDADDIVTEDNTEQTPSTAPSVTPSENPTVKPSEEDPAPAVDHKELTKSLAAATGIGGLDIDKILAECKTADDKKKAYERVLWHVGRIKSCNVESHLMHQGRYNQDGSESKLVKDLKTAFGQK